MIIDDENVIEVPNPFNNGTIHIVKDMFNEPMLIAKEILITLGYKDHKDAVKKHLSELAMISFLYGEGGGRQFNVACNICISCRIVCNSIIIYFYIAAFICIKSFKSIYQKYNFTF